jgi:hypothetical protein
MSGRFMWLYILLSERLLRVQCGGDSLLEQLEWSLAC